MSPIAAHIGPYRVERELGRGGMGVVYLAQDTRLDRWVAIKALPETFTADSSRLTRFIREAKILASLSHPGIGTIYGLEEIPSGEQFLILELVDGEPLATLLLSGPLPPGDALRLVEEIAGAVGSAHERGVVHRDLKPGNIMVTREGRAKVLDFGLAKVVRAPSASPGGGSAANEDSATGEGIVVGTVPYMSPEQLCGEAVDARSDVFSLGCVLFECLTACRAFQGESIGTVISAILEGQPAWGALPAGSGDGTRALLERCLAKRPEERPVDGRAVQAAIQGLLGSPVTRPAESGAPRHNLPVELTSFVGREAEIAACRGLFGSARLVTLTGIGGGGKTRLALEIARTTLGEYPHGAWLVDLASVSDPSRVALMVATTLGVSEAADRTVEDVLAAHLRARRALLVLDNCEHLLEACGALARRLLESCDSLRILATSREPLRVEGEHVHSVPPLPLEPVDGGSGSRSMSEAVQLFMDRANLAAPGFAREAEHGDDIHEICRQLDGIPLAIELAAARVRVLAIPELRARLHDRFRLLTRRISLPARHQTLLATIQWSYDHLSQDEQRLLRRLSVFAGGWTLRGAAAVAGGGADEFAVLDLLSHLDDKSLIVVERREHVEFRYRMLETVRQYARERLAESGEEPAALERYLDYAVVLAEEARPHLVGSGEEPWLARIDWERENLLAAHAACDGLPEGGEKGLRLLWAVRPYWAQRGLVGLGLRESRVALARPGAHAATTWRSELLFSTAWLAYFHGHYEEAAALAKESLAICRSREDRFGAANALAWLGAVEIARGSLDHAQEHLTEAVALAREPANRVILPPALHNCGSLKLLQGDQEGAAELFEEALALSRDVGRVEGVVVNLLSLSRVGIQRGRFSEARRRLAEGVRIVEERSLRLRGQAFLDESAALAAALEEYAVTARLWGASEAARCGMNVTREPSDDAFLGPWIARARASLGEAPFAAAEAAGAELSYPEALAEARAWLEGGGA